jgi:peptidoglycan/xylan/chitin deacetylase (PgdA/CDA1 family)
MMQKFYFSLFLTLEWKNPTKMMILQFHNVTKNFEFSVTRIPPRHFFRQLRELRDLGFIPLEPEELQKTLKENAKRGRFGGNGDTNVFPRVLITFDDGLSGVFDHAYPVLSSLGFKGIVFVVTAFIGKKDAWDANLGIKRKHMGVEEILELRKAGWLIGSHSHTHPDLRALSDKELEYELKKSKEILEDILEESITLFSYPFGLLDERVMKKVASAGFLGAFASYWTSGGKGPYAMRRIPVYVTDYSIKWKLNPSLLFRLLLLTQVGLASAGARMTPLLRRKFPILAKLFGIRMP